MKLPQNTRPLRQRQVVKIGGVALVGALAVGAALIAEHLAQRADVLRSGAAALAAMPDAPGIDAPCLAPALVSDALQRSAALDDGLHGAWLPASMWANALDQVLVQRVADSVLAKAVLPALACRLNERVAQLTLSTSQERSASYTAERDALLARADQVATLDAQLTDFALLTSAEGNAARKLDALSRLLVEQLGLTALPAQPSSLLGRALVLSAYPAAMNRISATRETQAQRITDALAPLPGELQRALLAEINAGPALHAALAKPRDSLRTDTEAFAQWLGWIQAEWLPFDTARNPCAQLSAKLATRFGALHLPSADQLRLATELQRLSAADQCHQPALDTLGRMQLAPEMPLIAGSNGHAALNPAWIVELGGLHALASQGFMTANGAQALSCVEGAPAWPATQISAALGHAREYQRFRAAQGLPALGAAADKPRLFDRVARVQLERAMNAAMLAAQTQAAPPSSQSAASESQDLAQASADFAQALQSLLAVQEIYGQLGLDASAAAFRQCARGFAVDALNRIKALATASKLYLPGPGSEGKLLELGSTALTRDYLAQALARAATLVAYARPFVTLLDSSATEDDLHAPARRYWNNTSRELQRYNEQKDAAGQVGQIETLLLETFAGLTTQNCAARLAAYKAADDASDLFAERRRALTTQVRRSCAASARTR